MTKIQPISSMVTPRFADVATFFRLPIIKDLNQLDYCLCGVPWDGGTTNRPGARHGPREIRNASSLIRLYHPISLKSPYDKFNIADIGDCPVNPADLHNSLKKIEKFYLSIIESKTIPLSIGGDHLVSLPILRALGKKEPLGLFQFDSHSDTWDSYFGGYKYTHGTPFRRAIEENLIDPKKYVMIGIRGSLYDPNDMKWARQQGITIITIDEYYEMGFTEVIKIVKNTLGDTQAYLTFDIDGIDPTFAPGTGTPEVGGFSVREAQLIIRELNTINFVGADVVEVSPPFDVNNMTSLVASTIAFEILCTMTRSNL
ncbi:MAG: Guanidinopropionase [Alphaproteobacteria bacterium MarineAlpha5_Bin2]|nr:agmatinase [Alphaproteobacteria bacterium]PPR53709.1 MAG: Guanidinopropionase [Alphaproteobacteria bacterium MarineAlpha5_Bin2]PPR56302.1 MAG: Guanidinopropionase [Alphaproteobacteria bacterium MarineAlpha5_Bin3]